MAWHVEYRGREGKGGKDGEGGRDAQNPSITVLLRTVSPSRRPEEGLSTRLKHRM